MYEDRNKEDCNLLGEFAPWKWDCEAESWSGPYYQCPESVIIVHFNPSFLFTLTSRNHNTCHGTIDLEEIESWLKWNYNTLNSGEGVVTVGNKVPPPTYYISVWISRCHAALDIMAMYGFRFLHIRRPPDHHWLPWMRPVHMSSILSTNNIFLKWAKCRHHLFLYPMIAWAWLFLNSHKNTLGFLDTKNPTVMNPFGL